MSGVPLCAHDDYRAPLPPWGRQRASADGGHSAYTVDKPFGFAGNVALFNFANRVTCEGAVRSGSSTQGLNRVPGIHRHGHRQPLAQAGDGYR